MGDVYGFYRIKCLCDSDIIHNKKESEKCVKCRNYKSKLIIGYCNQLGFDLYSPPQYSIAKSIYYQESGQIQCLYDPNFYHKNGICEICTWIKNFCDQNHLDITNFKHLNRAKLEYKKTFNFY